MRSGRTTKQSLSWLVVFCTDTPFTRNVKTLRLIPHSSKGEFEMKARLFSACLLSSVLVFTACGGSGDKNLSAGSTDDAAAASGDSQQDIGENGCGGSTREKPAPQDATIKCGDWSVSVSVAVNVPDEMILEANSANDLPESGGKYVAVRLKATYNGSGTGNLADVFGTSDGFLIGRTNKRYEDDMPCCKSDWDPWLYVDDPYEGGTVEGNLFFNTDSGDGEFVLALDFDSYNEVKAWIAVEPVLGKDKRLLLNLP